MERSVERSPFRYAGARRRRSFEAAISGGAGRVLRRSVERLRRQPGRLHALLRGAGIHYLRAAVCCFSSRRRRNLRVEPDPDVPLRAAATSRTRPRFLVVSVLPWARPADPRRTRWGWSRDRRRPLVIPSWYYRSNFVRQQALSFKKRSTGVANLRECGRSRSRLYCRSCSFLRPSRAADANAAAPSRRSHQRPSPQPTEKSASRSSCRAQGLGVAEALPEKAADRRDLIEQEVAWPGT